jgi:TonB family protein
MVAAITVRERPFWIGLACAAVMHVALIAGVVRHLPRQMGEATGRPEGISVELIDKADLEGKNTFAEDGGTPAVAAQPPPPKVASQTPPEPAPKQPPEPATETAPPQPPADAAAPAAPEAKANPWAADVEAPEKTAPPEPADQAKQEDAPVKPAQPKKQHPAEATPQPKPKPQEKLSLQLDLPPQAFMPGDQGAAVMRPAGITRSGENDDFGRGVIRALRRTMPASRVLGRVTVRFLLSPTGNIVEVRVASSSGDPVLDQSVVFAVKQASFPIPPQGSTAVDRSFQVTYIYH